MGKLAIYSLSIVALFSGCSASKPSEGEGDHGAASNPKAVLSRFVGDWMSDVTNKPAEWTPKEIKYRTLNHAEIILSEKFLKNLEVSREIDNPSRVGKALFIWGYDTDSKEFVGWLFHSNGNIGKHIGTWDAATKTLRSSLTEPPPEMSVVLTETFPEDNIIKGQLVFKREKEKPAFDMVWTRTRPPESFDSKAFQAKWASIDIPIEPVPEQTEKLTAFIGEWDSEYIHGPSVTSPKGNTLQGSMKADWILDGRFLLGSSIVGKHESVWVIGYDTNKETFRYIRFGNDGQIDENVGQWNERSQSFEWKTVNGRQGISKSSTTHIAGNVSVQTQVLAEGSDGKVRMDLTINSTRKR